MRRLLNFVLNHKEMMWPLRRIALLPISDLEVVFEAFVLWMMSSAFWRCSYQVVSARM